MSSAFDMVSDTETLVNTAGQSGGQPATCPICGSGQLTDLLTAPDRFHLRKEMYLLVRCQSCSGVWQDHPPSPAEMGQHYTEDYHNAIVAAGEGAASDRWKDQVKTILRYKSGGALLDMGCSSGGFLSTMKGPAWDLYGVEMEESTAERARTSTGAKVFVGDAVAAPFLPASFDVITCFDVLEHVYSPRQFLAKSLEWLKPGGIFYAMMPNIASWEARLFGDYWFGLELPRHITHFSPRSLRCLMTELGFEEVLVKTPPVSYVELSAGYICSSVFEKLGGTPTPQAKPKSHGIPFRIVRKGLREVVLSPLAHVASWAGAGPSMEVVYRKPASH
ncbi:MAG: class I SAM-dependent methyltransferase [Candidatus Sulfotelmatobacter sp.]